MTIDLAKQSLVTALLSSSLLFGLSVAHAGEHELWREQVPTAQSHRIELTRSHDVRHTSSALWREQVKSSADGQLAVYSARGTSSQSSGDYLFWREQVAPLSSSRSGAKLSAHK